jgi:hypothetical protein
MMVLGTAARRGALQLLQPRRQRDCCNTLDMDGGWPVGFAMEALSTH